MPKPAQPTAPRHRELCRRRSPRDPPRRAAFPARDWRVPAPPPAAACPTIPPAQTTESSSRRCGEFDQDPHSARVGTARIAVSPAVSILPQPNSREGVRFQCCALPERAQLPKAENRCRNEAPLCSRRPFVRPTDRQRCYFRYQPPFCALRSPRLPERPQWPPEAAPDPRRKSKPGLLLTIGAAVRRRRTRREVRVPVRSRSSRLQHRCGIHDLRSARLPFSCNFALHLARRGCCKIPECRFQVSFVRLYRLDRHATICKRARQSLI